jgi:hypothetical protein
MSALIPESAGSPGTLGLGGLFPQFRSPTDTDDGFQASVQREERSGEGQGFLESPPPSNSRTSLVNPDSTVISFEIFDHIDTNSAAGGKIRFGPEYS